MKNRLFTVIIVALLSIYALNQFVGSEKIETTLKNSGLYDLYQKYSSKYSSSDSDESSNDSSTVTAKPNIQKEKVSISESQYSVSPALISGDISVTHFQASIPKPAWYDSVESPIASTSEEVKKVWQSKKRCCESKEILKANNQEFYKTCYHAIENHFADEELVVRCLSLMDNVATRQHNLKIKRYLVTHFSHHKNNISRCVNCATADTVSRVTLQLASIQRRSNNPDESIQLVENILDKRRSEISPWVQTEIYTALAKWYTQDDNHRRQRVREALQNLTTMSESGNKSVNRRLPKFVKSADSFLNN